MTSDPEEITTSPYWVRLVLVGIGLAVAAGLLGLGISTHHERACLLMDTPYLPLCSSAENQSEADRQRALREYIHQNPGDSSAWIRLTNLESGEYEQPLLRAAIALAPNDPNVMMWRAGKALAENELVQATDLLIQIIVYRPRTEAAQMLARLVASGEGNALLHPYVSTADKWLPQVLNGLLTLKLPLASALPLVAEASAKGTIPRQTFGGYMRALKREGKWADAYALWVAQLGKAAPLLFNGSFETPFRPDGFDWEVTPAPPSRAGAILSLRAVRNRGQVLEVEYTGKPVAVPVIRQYLFLPAGKYLLRGQYMSSRLRAEQGLSWIARCSNSRSERSLAGQSAPLLDTAGKWQSFQFEVTVPYDCGLATSLQLETAAASEAAAGFKGRASFDSLELRGLPM